MELDPYVTELQRQLADAAADASTETAAVAERLAKGLDAAIRLVLQDALSAAAGEITRDLAPGSVDLRLRGREIQFVVTAAPETDEEASIRAPRYSTGGGGGAADENDASTSRTTLRLPDALKARV